MDAEVVMDSDDAVLMRVHTDDETVASAEDNTSDTQGAEEG